MFDGNRSSPLCRHSMFGKCRSRPQLRGAFVVCVRNGHSKNAASCSSIIDIIFFLAPLCFVHGTHGLTLVKCNTKAFDQPARQPATSQTINQPTGRGSASCTLKYISRSSTNQPVNRTTQKHLSSLQITLFVVNVAAFLLKTVFVHFGVFVHFAAFVCMSARTMLAKMPKTLKQNHTDRHTHTNVHGPSEISYGWTGEARGKSFLTHNPREKPLPPRPHNNTKPCHTSTDHGQLREKTRTLFANVFLVTFLLSIPALCRISAKNHSPRRSGQ